MSILSFGKNKREYILALDIGTEVVKALIFFLDAEQKNARVVGVGRTVQAPGNMQSGAIADIEGVITASQIAIAHALEQAGIKKIRKCILGIAGELVKGTTTTVHYERVHPEQKIGMPELRMIMQKVQEKAYERILKQIAWETNQSDIHIKLINAAMVDVRIDGYQISNPLNFQGKDVSMSIFNAYAPMIHLGALETIASELDLDLLSVAAEPYAVARSLDVEDIMDFSAIFIDLGGGTTDIAVVRNGGLEGTKMFALGGRAFTKRLAAEFRMTFDEAEKLKLDYAAGKLPLAQQEQLRTFFADDCRIWLDGVTLSLTEFAETDLLPSRIFLCGGGSGLPGIQEALGSHDWTAYLPFSKDPHISYLQPRDIIHVHDDTGFLINPQDITPVSLVNLAIIHHLDSEKVLANILQHSIENIK
jgi:cell division protein FtsA